jgi:glycosyltransferase involved in cell wall biosynthesis
MITNDKLSFIHEDGRRLIKQHFSVFRSLVVQAKDFAEQGKYEMAAIYADMAVAHAFMQHCGLFVSPELEQILLTIGRNSTQESPYRNQGISSPGTSRNVLHVVTFVRGIGGHTRLIWRWIQQDSERSHSLVLMRQSTEWAPKILKDAVLNSQGKLYDLNGSFVSRAKQLRKIATEADIVVLHGADQIIPTIAFSNRDQSPPIITVNHGDDSFGVGVAITDVLANLRESGVRLSLERRGIEAERNALLPIILSPFNRTLSRAEAKQQIGIPENSVVIFSIARKEKYRTIDGINISFAEAHIPILERYDQAVLLVIGPDNSEDWSAAIQRTQGRIRVLEEREDSAVFYQAADIYVDSFPILSNTSLLEAGSYGVPLVSYFPYSNTCEIFGADMPGLTGNFIRVQDIEEYTAVLSRLVEDEEFRLSLGEATRRKIVDIHLGSNWQHSLEELYVRAATLPRITVTSDLTDQIFLGEPDVMMPRRLSLTFDQEKTDIDEMLKARVPFIPFEQRLSLWFKLFKKRDLGRSSGLNILLPQWLYSILRKLIPLN